MKKATPFVILIAMLLVCCEERHKSKETKSKIIHGSVHARDVPVKADSLFGVVVGFPEGIFWLGRYFPLIGVMLPLGICVRRELVGVSTGWPGNIAVTEFPGESAWWKVPGGN